MQGTKKTHIQQRVCEPFCAFLTNQNPARVGLLMIASYLTTINMSNGYQNNSIAHRLIIGFNEYS